MRRGRTQLRRLGVLAVVAAGALLLSACTAPAEATSVWPSQVQGGFPSSVEASLKGAVTKAMTLSGASGAIVGVWAPWAGSWTAGLGTTQIKGSEPVTTAMRFRIGQNTTPMTCSVLLSMVDAGRVGLDDKVSKYLPQMTGIGGITLRELCLNTSGLGDYNAQLQPQFVNNPKRQWSQLELVTDGMGASGSAGPTSTYVASDAGLVLLGMALQAESGQTWQQLYQQYVFGRLSMTSSSFPTATETSIPGAHMTGYATALDPVTGALVCGTVLDDSSLSPSMTSTAGGVISSLSDLKSYVQALTSGTLVSKSLNTQQWETIAEPAPAPSWKKAGLGVMALGPLRGSSGSIPGYISTMLSDPTSGLTVVVVLNNSSAGAGFAQTLGEQLASIASKAPAKSGKAPVVSLPWSQDQAAAALTAAAVCQPPAPAPAK